MSIHAIYDAISPQFRRRRMHRFITAVALQPNERILDIGGTAEFWMKLDPGCGIDPRRVTLLNIDPAPEGEARAAGMEFVHGDGGALPFRDAEFPVAFSNSAIEHVGTWERQQAFAAEVRRVAHRVWVQTPAREFFIEPHLIAPFIHWFTPRVQRRLIRHFTVRGWIAQMDRAAIETFLKEVRLLSAAEMRALFPDCILFRERFLGFTKSYIAVR